VDQVHVDQLLELDVARDDVLDDGGEDSRAILGRRADERRVRWGVRWERWERDGKVNQIGHRRDGIVCVRG